MIREILLFPSTVLEIERRNRVSSELRFNVCCEADSLEIMVLYFTLVHETSAGARF